MRRLLVTLILGVFLASAAGCADLGISNPFESTPTAASSQLLGISLPAGMELSTQHCARTTGSDGQPQGMETAYGQADRMQVAQSLFNNMQGAGWNVRMSLRKADRIMLAFENGNRLAVINIYPQTVYSCVTEIWVSEKMADGSSLNLLPLRGEGGQNSGGFGGFGGSARQANPNAPRKGQDIRVRITLSFDEAVHGCKKNITITRQQECTECHGSGCAAGTSPETCPDCGGRGFVIRQQRTPFGVMQTQQPCSRCGGKGKLVKNPCKVCHGSGKTAARKTLEVSIPMGIDDDQSFALRGMGDAGANGGPAGDVIVMVSVRPSEVFQRDGYDVWVTVPITYSQAVLGDSITVPSIDGKVEYTVPEGTQSGTTFRLRGKGIQYLNGRGRGDMYVKCEVEIPKKLNKAQRDALKKFEGTLKEENYEKRKGFFKKLKDMFA